MDAGPGDGMDFYARIPFARSGLRVENVQLLNRPELAQVAYLELKGSLKTDGTTTAACKWRVPNWPDQIKSKRAMSTPLP